MFCEKRVIRSSQEDNETCLQRKLNKLVRFSYLGLAADIQRFHSQSGMLMLVATSFDTFPLFAGILTSVAWRYRPKALTPLDAGRIS